MTCPCGFTYCYRSCSPATKEAYLRAREAWKPIPLWHEKVAAMLEEDQKDAKEEKEGSYR